MAELLEQLKVIWEGDIVSLPFPFHPPYMYFTTNTSPDQDLKGQSLAEILTYALLTVTGVLSFFAGFLTQNIHNTLYIGLGGTALTFLVVVPPWPVYNSHPLPWLPARNPSAVGSGTRGLEGIDVGSISVDGKKVS
ncbi:SPC12-domain-containing protein [Teratosphaeria destructans]|uniref:Signal peptidase complex subunit 1 n=1 Tax=Teratosphaeria destructans TaxID=418781 RepID=A0A9W7VY66_9PEZI|nr:SPC12-domain-containing protein [Teratosphaeria destructans]